MINDLELIECFELSKKALSFQNKVVNWLHACFGESVAKDKTERSHRFLEEALELVQAAGTSKEECLQLVDYVFAREVGDLPQEVGGAMNTLAALCNAHDICMEDAAWNELSRCWQNIEKIRTKRMNKPDFGPLPQ